MADIYVKSGGGSANSGTYRGVWLASTAFAAGDRVVSTTVTSYRVHECTTAGTTGASAPTFSTTTNGTTSDGTVTWTTRLPSTWANATVDLTRAAANDAAGDTIWVSHQHAETTAAAVAPTYAGTVASPVRIICADDTSGEPPATLATTATVSTTGANNLTAGPPGGVSIYVYGVTFQAGDGANAADLRLVQNQSSFASFENCNFVLSNSNTASRISVAASTAPSITYLKNCGVKFGNASQNIALTSGRFRWEGGSLLSGGTSPTALFSSVNAAPLPDAFCSGIDLSNADAAISLSASTSGSPLVLVNCKMPAAWSGSINSATPTVGGGRYALYNCDSGDTNYRIEVKDHHGTLTQETTLVRTGGATDGTTALAWKVVTNSTCSFRGNFRTPDIVKWNETTGSALTATVEILHDSATALKDDEVWVELQYLGTSGYPLGGFISDAKATPIATPANQTSSSATWTTTGMANANKQSLSVTFTPQEKGFIQARVCVGKPSYTLYVDPKLTVT